MEFEFVENFYDTIKSRQRVAALRKTTNVLEVDENSSKKKRKTIRRNNLKSKGKNGLKGNNNSSSKAKVRRRKAPKDTQLSSPSKRRANSNKKTPTPSPKKSQKLVVPATVNNNEIDDEEAAYILCNLSTISARSFDSFYTRFPATADNKIEIPILSEPSSFNQQQQHHVAHSDQPYSHILLDHNYWSAANQPEIKFELRVDDVQQHSNLNPVEAVDDRPEQQPEKSIENEVKVEVKQEVVDVVVAAADDMLVNKQRPDVVVDVKVEQQQQPEVNNNLLAESLLSIVKHEREEEAATAAAATAKALTTTTKVKQKKAVQAKKKEKCRKILNTTTISSGKKKTQNKTIKKRKEKKVSLSNGFASQQQPQQPANKQRSKSREKVDNVDDNAKKCESPSEEQNHDKTSAIVAEPQVDVKQNGIITTIVEEDQKNGCDEIQSNGHDDRPHQKSSSDDVELDENDVDDDADDERSWTVICDFHGTILDKLTSNNVRFCGDMMLSAESRSATTTRSSSSSSSSASGGGGVKIVGSMNNYQTSLDSRYYDSASDYYASHRSSDRYDPVTNCDYRRPSYASSRSQDPRTNNSYSSYDNNRHRKEHFHRHHSYSESSHHHHQQTYASYKAQKTFEQRQMPLMMDSGNPMLVKQQSVSVFELPVNNGASSIVKDLLPIIERKELLRSMSVADPRLAPISDGDKSQYPKKKLSLDQYRKRLSSSNISEDFSRDQSSNQTT